MTDERWLERARATLDREVGEFDGETRSKLTRARSRALEARHGRRGMARLLAPSLAGAALAALLLTIPQRLPHPGRAPATAVDSAPLPPLVPLAESAESPAFADLELLAADMDLELLADLEFYLWLEGELSEGDAG